MRRPRSLALVVVLGIVLSQSVWASAGPRSTPSASTTSLGVSFGLPPALGARTLALPASLDTDGDGWMDGVEAALGSDPAYSTSTPEPLAVPESCMDATDDDGDGSSTRRTAGALRRCSRKAFPAAGIDSFDSTIALDAYDLVTPLGTCPFDFAVAVP